MPPENADAGRNETYAGGRNEDNQRHGVGIWTNADGRRYAGGWRNGKRHGEGTMEYADGSSYTGGFCDGLRDGAGRYASASSDMYDGEWKKGLMHGSGKLIGQLVAARAASNSNSAATEAVRGTYVGEFLEGRVTGQGRVVYAVGSGDDDSLAAAGWQYEGAFRDGRRHGHGTIGDHNGRMVYRGGWHEDRYHGFGELFHRDGRTHYRGQWRYGQRSSFNYYRAKGWLAWLLRSSPPARLLYWLCVDMIRLGLALAVLVAALGIVWFVLLGPAAET